jgi:PKD repeat protein
MIECNKNVGLSVSLTEYQKLRLPLGQGHFLDTPNKLVVRDTLKRFLADAQENSNEKKVLFDLVVGGKERASRSRPVGATRIAITELDAFEEAVQAFLQKQEAPDTSPEARVIIENFRLPDPEIEPEMYRLYGPPWNQHLLALWGCERRQASSLPPLEAIKKLRLRFKPLWQIWLERGLWLLLLLLVLAAAGLGLAKLCPGCRVKPPTIISQPYSQKVQAGKDATFSVVAKGAEPLAYQWRMNGNQIPDATNSDYTVWNVPTNASGNYDVLVTNITGTVTSSNASLTVLPLGTPLPPPPSTGGQYLVVVPVEGMLPTNIAAWARAAGTIDFHGQKRVQSPAGQTNYYDGFGKSGNYLIKWTPKDSTLNGEFKTVTLRNGPPPPQGHSDQADYTPQPQLPHANLQLIPETARLGETTRADEQASYHDDSKRKLVKFEINWEGQFQALDDGSRTHTFASTGSYQVVLRVTDDAGRTDEDDAFAYVGVGPPANKPPIAKLRLVAMDTNKLTAVVADGGSVDPDGHIVTWVLNWGDRSPDERFTTAPTNQFHKFEKSGTYSVSLQCVDDKQEACHQPDRVEVALGRDLSPPIHPDFSPYIFLTLATEKQSERRVSFSAGVEASAFPVPLNVDFGDGSSPASSSVGSPRSGGKHFEEVHFDHAYSRDGIYTVTAKATDPKGHSTSRQVTIRVPEAKPRAFLISMTDPQKAGDRFKVTFVVVDKDDPVRTDFTVQNWLVNGAQISSLTRDRMATEFSISTNEVYAIVQLTSGDIHRPGLRVKIPKETRNVPQIQPGAPTSEPLPELK